VALEGLRPEVTAKEGSKSSVSAWRSSTSRL
jgi:hypothetical protein